MNKKLAFLFALLIQAFSCHAYVSVERAHRQDCKDLRDILRDALSTNPTTFYKPFSDEELENFTEERFQSALQRTSIDTFVARDSESNQPVGYIQFTHEPDGHIHVEELMVHSSQRKCGIGKQLLSSLPPSTKYSLYVVNRNKNAIGCYQHLGFEIKNSDNGCFLMESSQAISCY